MVPYSISNLDHDEILAITNQGRMLLFPIKDLPQLGKGKGNKIINIPAAKAKEREEVGVSFDGLTSRGFDNLVCR